MAASKTLLMTRALTLTLFVSSVAFGVGSTQPMSANAGASGGASNPTVLAASAAAQAANASSSSPPVVVSGPADPTSSAQKSFDDGTGSNQAAAAAAAAAQANRPKAGPTTFVPSVVEKVEPPKPVAVVKATLHTTMGDITVRLFKNEAPHTVQNFLDLAKGERDFLDPKTSKKVHRPFYTGLIFHRVIKDFMIQTGCPFGTGRGDPGYNIADEIGPNLKFDKPGILGMALAQDGKKGYEKNSNGSQFFITLAPQPAFNSKFTIFGEVVSGMDVAQRIGHVHTGPTDRPIKKVYLLSIDVDEPSPALLQTSAVPTGVNLALPIAPPINQAPPVNQALGRPEIRPEPSVPQMPNVSMPMPASMPTTTPQTTPTTMPNSPLASGPANGTPAGAPPAGVVIKPTPGAAMPPQMPKAPTPRGGAR